MAAPTVGILLAAGRGRRFDPAGRAQQAAAALARPAASRWSRPARASCWPRCRAWWRWCRPTMAAWARCWPSLGCEVTVCPDADSGMAASLTHAIRHSPGHDRARRCLAGGAGRHAARGAGHAAGAGRGAGRRAPASPPRCCDGRRGNPVGFGRVHLDALLALRGDQGARAPAASLARSPRSRSTTPASSATSTRPPTSERTAAVVGLELLFLKNPITLRRNRERLFTPMKKAIQKKPAGDPVHHRAQGPGRAPVQRHPDRRRARPARARCSRCRPGSRAAT